ncbi:hypothetical protein, partial [Kitasatospora sp. NPDC085879]|uniref:hypothetical protein n=1 Tax=Kitasatospora sp. NPDC085879 TaxID=3154769 RepID=UPI003434AA40
MKIRSGSTAAAPDQRPSGSTLRTRPWRPACRSRFPKKHGCTRCWRPADHTAGFVADIRAAATHEPVLLADLDGRAHGGDDGRD